MNPTFFILGALGGLAFVLAAYAIHRRTKQILFSGLVIAALAYLAFSLRRPSWSWLVLELAGVAVYGGVAFVGLKRSSWWLAAGWALHPLWDVALHFFGPGHAFAPEPYTIACLSWDLVVAACIGWRIARPQRRMSATLNAFVADELAGAKAAEAAGDLRAAWWSLERAHVLTQFYAGPHLRVHALMAAFAWRRRDRRELLGQVPRLFLAAPGSWTGRAPAGNTGGTNVGIFTPVVVPRDLAAILESTAT